MSKLNQRSLDRLKGISPILITILIEAAESSPIEFQIPQDGGLRTPERQNELFTAKKSLCDGYKKLSKHQGGTAFDIFLMIDGKASWDKPRLKQVMYHIKEVALKHNVSLNLGCDWVKFIDYPHAEIK